jgi:transcriptional regulator with XRE-family HTH domain
MLAVSGSIQNMQGTIDTETLTAKIRQGMERLGINQAELARRSGITRSALTQILAGDRRNPTTPVLMSIAEVLGVSVDYLIGKSEISEIEDLLHNDSIRELVNGFLKLKAGDQLRVLQMIDIFLKTGAEN